MTWVDLEGYNLLVPQVSKGDFFHSLSTTKSTVSQEQLDQYEKFTEEFGQEG